MFQTVADGQQRFWLTNNRGMLRIAQRDADAVADGRQTQWPAER